MKARRCKDCTIPPGTPLPKLRPAPNPGPRCATHWRAEKKRRSARAHERRLDKVYGLAREEYDALLEYQGGVCAICRRATGKTRRLSVDHDHETGKVRGLLCRPCNDVLGHARDDVVFFRRADYYLRYPPAGRVGLDREVPSDLDPRQE